MTVPNYLVEYNSAQQLLPLQLNFENLIIHSRLSSFEKRELDSGLSIKLVLEGQELYTIDNHTYCVNANQFIVVNKHQSFDCWIDSKDTEEANAFCIYLAPQQVQEVYNALYNPAQLIDQEQMWAPPVFLNKVFDFSENQLGQFLKHLCSHLIRNRNHIDWDASDLFYRITEKLLFSQSKINQQLKNMDSVKCTTKEELYRRLSRAHQFILNNYKKDVSLDALAKIAMLSKYHLLRNYKQVYNQTPYQQVLELRLNEAKKLVKHDFSFEEIAFKVGFSDRRSFTKAFKRVFGCPPSTYRRDTLFQ